MNTLPCEAQEEGQPARKGQAHSCTEVGTKKHMDSDCKTETVPYTKIVRKDCEGAVQNLDCSAEFSFEKERIKAMEHTQLFASLNTVHINQETAMYSQAWAAVVLARELALQKPDCDQCRQAQVALVRLWKILAVVMTLFGTANLIAAFFGILVLSISSLPIGDFILWLTIEIIMTIMFMYLSVKASNAAQFTSESLTTYLKWLLVFTVGLVSLLVAVALQGSLPSTVACAKEWNQTGKRQDEVVYAMVCIVLLSIFFSTLYKLLTIAIYLVLCVLLRCKLVSLSLLETQNPPLPVTVYPHNPPVLLATPSPYSLPLPFFICL